MTKEFGDIRPGGDWQFGPVEKLSEAVWREAKKTSFELLNTYELLMPGEDHGVHPLSEGPAVDWASLEGALIECMVEGLRGNESIHPTQYGVLSNADGPVSVAADHLVNDFWWVECSQPRDQGSGDPETGGGGVPSVAIMRISGSGERLPYDESTSLRIV